MLNFATSRAICHAPAKIFTERPDTTSYWDHITGFVYMVAQQIQSSLFQPVYSCIIREKSVGTTELHYSTKKKFPVNQRLLVYTSVGIPLAQKLEKSTL